jgi:hypothetical protein
MLWCLNPFALMFENEKVFCYWGPFRLLVLRFFCIVVAWVLLHCYLVANNSSTTWIYLCQYCLGHLALLFGNKQLFVIRVLFDCCYSSPLMLLLPRSSCIVV